MSQSGIGPISPEDAYKLRSPYERRPPCFQSPEDPDDEEFAQPDLPKADEDEEGEEDDFDDEFDEDFEDTDEDDGLGYEKDDTRGDEVW